MAAIAGALSRATELAGPLLAGLLLFPTLGVVVAAVALFLAPGRQTVQTPPLQ